MTLNGFTTRQGTDRDTNGTHESQNGWKLGSAQLGADLCRRSMTERRLKSAFYQGQLALIKRLLLQVPQLLKRHLKVAF